MSTPYEKIQIEYQELIAKYKEAITDGKLSFSDAIGLLMHGSFSIAKLMQGYVDMPFEQRKAVGVDLCVQFYDDVIAPIDLPIPNIIEPMVDKTVGLMVKPLVESIYDAVQAIIYDKLN